jgi:conserved oligomeric Golgi complex subunit 3
MLAALAIDGSEKLRDPAEEQISHLFQDELLVESQQDYLYTPHTLRQQGCKLTYLCSMYRDQLAMTERHLGSLIEDTNGALALLSSLAESFRIVDEQTTSFQAQCDDLLSEQKRLQQLADEVGTDLHYYAYLDNATRRLNAPGASRLVDDDAFEEILTTLDTCIAFMARNVTNLPPKTSIHTSYPWRIQKLILNSHHIAMPSPTWRDTRHY